MYRMHNSAEEPMSIEELAADRKVSVTHVRKLLKVHTAPEALKGLIVKGVVAYYAALDVMEKYPDNCVAIIQEAFDKFGKATDKTIGQVLLAKRTGENDTNGESDGNVTTITTTDAGNGSNSASDAAAGVIESSAGNDAGVAGGGSEEGEGGENPNRNGPLRRNANLNKISNLSRRCSTCCRKKISKEIVDNSLDVINRIVTEAKEIPFMEDGAEVLAKAQYQLTLTYEEFLQLTAAKDSYDKHLEKIQKKTQSNNI